MPRNTPDPIVQNYESHNTIITVAIPCYNKGHLQIVSFVMYPRILLLMKNNLMIAAITRYF